MTGLLVVGGGRLQLFSLRRARELGIRTHLVDGNTGCAARSSADEFYNLSTKDPESVASLAQKLAARRVIDGVYTQGTDVEYTVALAAERAGFPGVTSEAARNCQDKARTRHLLAEHGVGNVRYRRVTSGEEAKAAIKEVGLPSFVKPADNSASRGATRVSSADNMKGAIRTALSMCKTEAHVIVEEELHGSEHSVDTILEDGVLYPAGISDRMFLSKSKVAVQVGSRTPSSLPHDVQERMYQMMAAAAKALGVTCGAFKGDLIWDAAENRMEIIEVTARTSGGYDSQLRKPLSFGVDLMKATIDLALGRGLDFRDLIPKWVRWSETSAVFPPPGIVREVRGVSEAQQICGVADLAVFVEPGDLVHAPLHSADRTNVFTCVADTAAQLADCVTKVGKILRVETMSSPAGQEGPPK